ncbi:MAG: response regulator transcription factor [Planctomycetota bacterium]
MPQHILVVEDETHLGVGIKFNLEAEGYRVTLVEDGPTALRLMKSNSAGFDLVVLDIMLPGMSGYAVCEAIRDDDVHLPVLMLSARTLAEDRTRGFDVGANQYMSKPFDLDELLSRVKNLLLTNGHRAAAPTTTTSVTQRRDRESVPVEDRVTFGMVAIDFASHTVTVAGDERSLSSRELSLLRYFLEHRGRVISRAELLAEIWDLSGNVQTRAVDQCIARVRKVIEPDTARPKYLLTVRDAGYRFVTGIAPGESESSEDAGSGGENALG